jgi:hypothetical protein
MQLLRHAVNKLRGKYMPVSQLPAREIDLFSSDHIKRIVEEIESEQNRRRKRNAWVLNQCLEGNQREYVVKRLAQLYPDTYSKFSVGDINISKKIDLKLSKAYKNPPIRKCYTDKQTEELNDIYSKYHFDRAFKEADSIFNLHKYVALWLTWQNPDVAKGIEEGHYILHALKPYEYDLIRDQVTGEPIVFIQSHADTEITRLAGRSDGIEQTISESQSDRAAQTRIYYLWNAKQYVEVVVKKAFGHGNTDKEQINVNYIDRKPNLLGRLPISYLQADSSVDYPVSSNLAEQSTDWNIGLSNLKTSSSAQGHGQLVITHPEGQKYKSVHMGMHTAITLPQSKKPDAPPTDAKYISANPDLQGQLDVLKFDLMNILDDYGIKAKSALTGGVEQFSSGFDRLLSEADVQDEIEDNQSLYSKTLEQGTFKIAAAYEEAMSNFIFRGVDELEVTFEKPKVLISDKETLENLDKREQLGLLLPHEKHLIINPNLTEEQAKEREEEIRAYKEEMLKKMQATFEESDEEDDNEDDEEVEE